MQFFFLKRKCDLKNKKYKKIITEQKKIPKKLSEIFSNFLVSYGPTIWKSMCPIIDNISWSYYFYIILFSPHFCQKEEVKKCCKKVSFFIAKFS
jgi:hypothetical protein